MKNSVCRTEDRAALIDIMLDMGEALLSAGAEINRVEDTIARLGSAYEATRVSVFVITSSIVITVAFADDSEITQTRRILKSVQTDFNRLEQLNKLSRECTASPFKINDLRSRVEKIVSAKPRRSAGYMGGLLAAGAFAVFFGGNILDGLLAAAFAVIICLLQDFFAPVCPNRVFFYFCTAFITGLGICALSSPLSFLHADKIMIGDIMLLIPGIAITNSVRDILIGDTLSGTMRFVESLIWAVAIAGGFMLSIVLIGGAAL